MEISKKDLLKLADAYSKALEGGEKTSMLRLHAAQAGVNLEHVSFQKIDRLIIYNVFLAAYGQQRLMQLLKVINNDGINLENEAVEVVRDNDELPRLRISNSVKYLPTAVPAPDSKIMLFMGKVVNNSKKSFRVIIEVSIGKFAEICRESLDVPPGETDITKAQTLVFLQEELIRISQTVTESTLSVEMYLPGFAHPIDVFRASVLLSQPDIVLIAQSMDNGQIFDYSNSLAWLVNSGANGLANLLLNILPQEIRFALGYSKTSEPDSVDNQVKSLFTGLQQHDFTYLPTELIWIANDSMILQRVRKPEDIIQEHEKRINCLDGAILFASLLEYIGLDPVIVILPQHSLVGWKRLRDKKNSFPELLQNSGFLDPTFLSTKKSFDVAVSSAEGYLLRHRHLFERTVTSLEEFSSLIEVKSARQKFVQGVYR